MRSDPPSLLSDVRTLAFAGRLRAAERALGPAGRDSAEAAWLRAYVLTARGNYGAAETILNGLVARDDPSGRSRAAASLGSLLRQTGRHAEARAIESVALRRAPTPDLRAHLLIGLAADAVGLGDLRSVDRSLRRAAAAARGDWRIGVRLRWVRCERELLAGRPAQAAAWARRAGALSVRAGARRHEAKSLLFVGASSLEAAGRASGARAARSLAEAERSLRRARAIAARIGARPIERVAAELLRRITRLG